MKLLLCWVFLIVGITNTYSQDSIPVARLYQNNFPVTSIDSFFHRIPNSIFVFLDQGFDDSLEITVNGIPYLNQFMKTNESIGYAGHFGVEFKDSAEVLVLKIRFVHSGYCIIEQLNLSYKSLRIDGPGVWSLFYNNRFPLRK